ncbi:MAG: hypothetical protein AAF685_18325 [Cyanobacteria bacterium P01_C01_bin.89]
MAGFGVVCGAGSSLYSGVVGDLWSALSKNISSNIGAMVRYQDSPTLIVVLVVGYLGFIYCLLLLAQQQWGRSRSLLPKRILRQWQRFQNPHVNLPSANLMEVEDDLAGR